MKRKPLYFQDKRVMNLSGVWTLAGNGTDGKPIKIFAAVPGHVHTALENEDIIPPMFWRDNADQCQWVENGDWTYSRDFTADLVTENERVFLEFDGLDTFANIKLNGKEVGQTHNMFIPHKFDVTKFVLPENHLEVEFKSIHHFLAGTELAKYSACFNLERIAVRRMQCTFGWDWVHRFVSVGIWRPARLARYTAGKLTDLWMASSNQEVRNGEINIIAEVEMWTEDNCELEFVINIGQDEIGLVRIPVRQKTEQVNIKIKNPQIWWPNGYGEQPLYTCNTSLYWQDKQVDRKSFTFGLRTIEIEEIPDQRGASFTLTVNGKRIFARGANWVPADPFPERVLPAQYEQLIRIAAEANMNIVRAWGGGIFESPSFWDACNRYGIMVTQDFLLACAQYPDDQKWFMEEMQHEVEAGVRMLRNHPSLVLWSGDNELGMMEPEDSQYNGRIIWEKVTAPILQKLDPYRPAIPTSPYRGTPTNNSPDIGDCHISPWYNTWKPELDYKTFRRTCETQWGRFISECAAMGAPPLHSLRRFMSDEDISEHGETMGKMWEYHTKNNPYSGREDTHINMLYHTVTDFYGKSDKTADLVAKLGYWQADYCEYYADSIRRRVFDASGIMFWMYNDCWPSVGWSLVDYWGIPKAGYYGAKRSFAPVACSIEEKNEGLAFWVAGDYDEKRLPAQLKIMTSRFNGEKKISLDYNILLPSNGAEKVGSFTYSDLKIEEPTREFVCSELWFKGCLKSRRVFFPMSPKEMEFPPARLSVSIIKKDKGFISIRISTDNYARVVSIDEDLILSDNYFDLPAQSEVILNGWSPTGSYPEKIKVYCWNQKES